MKKDWKSQFDKKGKPVSFKHSKEKALKKQELGEGDAIKSRLKKSDADYVAGKRKYRTLRQNEK